MYRQLEINGVAIAGGTTEQSISRGDLWRSYLKVVGDKAIDRKDSIWSIVWDDGFVEEIKPTAYFLQF